MHVRARSDADARQCRILGVHGHSPQQVVLRRDLERARMPLDGDDRESCALHDAGVVGVHARELSVGRLDDRPRKSLRSLHRSHFGSVDRRRDLLAIDLLEGVDDGHHRNSAAFAVCETPDALDDALENFDRCERPRGVVHQHGVGCVGQHRQPGKHTVLPLGTADDCAAAARETGCFEHPLCLLQAICWHDDNCLLESRQLCNGLERALEHRSGADRHECLRRVSLQPRAAASGNDDDSNTHGCALGEGPTGPAPRRGSRWPCLRRPSWQAPARRRGSGGPSRACASRLPTGRGPGRDATGRGRPRSP